MTKILIQSSILSLDEYEEKTFYKIVSGDRGQMSGCVLSEWRQYSAVEWGEKASIDTVAVGTENENIMLSLFAVFRYSLGVGLITCPLLEKENISAKRYKRVRRKGLSTFLAGFHL